MEFLISVGFSFNLTVIYVPRIPSKAARDAEWNILVVGKKGV